jgi:2-keto-4-pentenoate hydratase
VEGLDRMLELRRGLLAEGARPLGWKLGFGSAAAQQQLGTSAPLVGFLTDRTLLEPGATVSLADYANPVLEPEVAVYVDASGAVTAVGIAFELADLAPPPDDPASVLGRNVYHRAVVLGPERAPSPDGLRARLLRDGEEVAATDDVGALNGDPVEGARLVARTVGGELRDGDVVIAGSVVPPAGVRPGERWRYELEPLGALELTFA